MTDRLDLIPAALYARVSSDRQDVDLSVAAQLRALRDYAERNGYLVAREYVDEAESGRTADRPQFRRMLDEAAKSEAPFKEILVWKFSRFTRKREHAVAFKSMLRRKGIRVVSITEHADDSPPASSWRPSSSRWMNSTAKIWRRKLCEGCERPPLEASGWQPRALRLPQAHGAGRGQEAAHPRTDAATSAVVERIFGMAEAGRGILDITRTLNDEGSPTPRGGSGPRTASISSSETSPTRGHWSGAQTPRTTPTRCGWRRRFPPSSPGRSCSASGSI